MANPQDQANTSGVDTAAMLNMLDSKKTAQVNTNAQKVKDVEARAAYKKLMTASGLSAAYAAGMLIPLIVFSAPLILVAIVNTFLFLTITAAIATFVLYRLSKQDAQQATPVKQVSTETPSQQPKETPQYGPLFQPEAPAASDANTVPADIEEYQPIYPSLD